MPKTWSDYTPEQKAKSAAQHKMAKYLRESGRPQRVPMGPAQRKLHRLRDVYGMSSHDVAVHVGLSQSTISDLTRGHRSPQKGRKPIVTVPRRTHDLIMAYEPDPAFYNPDARVPLIATQRRLQALCMAGYTSVLVADLLGRKDWNRTWSLMRGLTRAGGPMEGYVYAKTRDTIKELFDKYIDVDPLDVGGTKLGVSRSARIAALYGYVPASCWDEDTIEDESAIPEWTGMCGTQEGWISHHLFDIPLCPACEAAVTFGKSRSRERLGEVQARYEFYPDRAREAMARRELTRNGLEMEMGLTKGITNRWFSDEGGHSPSWKSGLKLAAFLDLSWTDIYKLKETS